MTQYIVTHERGIMGVIADSEEEAREQYYNSIEGMVGHYLKICGCFGPKSPIDRTKVSQIVSIEEGGKIDEKGG
jgi:hypothetical protein